jgi:FSR family fosmidomycin resistance protein-like MFS transporter
MTVSTDLPVASRRADDARLVAGVSGAHFVSHFYLLVLPPLFAFVRADYGVSYTELGLALTVLNAVSAVLQTPAGFLIDRMNARLALVAALALGAVAFVVAALVNSFWVLIAMFALLGLANSIYHPADYALLSRHVAPERMSQAYSVHTFAGMLGSASTPVTILFMHSLFGWRGAFLGAAAFGFLAALVLLFQRDSEPIRAAGKPLEAAAEAGTSWRLLLTAPILINLAFFTLLAFAGFGLQNFSVVALGALYGTSPITANAALSGHLILSALGVLIGGWIAGRITHYRLAASLGLFATVIAAIVIASVDLGALLLILVMSLSGLCAGMVMPSRDMIVREVTPPGAFGSVFGFVTNGFNIAGIIAPLLFGALLDHDEPRTMFYIIAALSLLSICAVASVPRRRAA